MKYKGTTAVPRIPIASPQNPVTRRTSISFIEASQLWALLSTSPKFGSSRCFGGSFDPLCVRFLRLYEKELSSLDNQPIPPLSFCAMNRREFLYGSAASAAAMSLPEMSFSQATQKTDFAPIWAEIEKRHDESLKRLQTWMRQPSIAAENR